MILIGIQKREMLFLMRWIGKEEDIKYNVVDDREYLSISDKYGILDLEIKRMNGETMEELLEILKGIRADVDFEKEEKLIMTKIEKEVLGNV